MKKRIRWYPSLITAVFKCLFNCCLLCISKGSNIPICPGGLDKYLMKKNRKY